MPNYAYMATELRCPACNTIVTDMLWFQWGYCPAQLPREDFIYHVGDLVHWKSCKDGSTPSWTYFSVYNSEGELIEWGGNIGSPAQKNLIVRDRQLWLEQACSTCGQELGGAAIEIRDGAIVRAWICLPGELEANIDIFNIESDGSRKAMPEWDDHIMDRIYDC